jgi:hypothetical protein
MAQMNTRSNLLRLMVLSWITLVVGANFVRHSPRYQNKSQNLIAATRPCSEVIWGWPLSIYSQYPEGFYDPRDPLWWDSDTPFYEIWHPIHLIINVFVAVGATLLLVVVWRVKERGELTHLRAPRFDPPGRRD